MKNTKILCNLCLHFARQDGQERKKRKENHATKVTKIPKKTKEENMGRMKHFPIISLIIAEPYR